MTIPTLPFEESVVDADKIRDMADEDGFIKFRTTIGAGDVFWANGVGAINELIDDMFLGLPGCLGGLSYRVVGCVPGDEDSPLVVSGDLVVEVSASAYEILDELDEEGADE